MGIVSVIAIYFVVWVFCAFILLPFGIRTHDEMGHDKIEGQADSAPANFRPGRLVLLASLLAGVLTAAWLLNWDYGWVTLDDVNFIPVPEEYRQPSNR